MHSQVIIVSLLLLLPGAVLSYIEVRGSVGHSVTLPCTYSVSRGVNSICWGRGVCPTFKCLDTLIWTDGYSVTYWSQSRYQLKGQIMQGNVSLTIDNVTPSDAGMYCCRVQVSGWFNDLKYVYSLQVTPQVHTTRPPATRPITRPRPTNPPPTTRVSTAPPPTQKKITTPATTPSPTWNTETPSTTVQETGTPLTGLPVPSCAPTDGNDTATACSDGHWSNQTELPIQKHQGTDKLGLYVGIGVSALVLLLLLSAVFVTNHIHRKLKMGSLSFLTYTVPKSGTLQKVAEVRPRAVDNIYVIEDHLYATN
uniref:hepatitis A virus cellular receptor 1 homolog isoform X1 n=1 Tax=Jaculus jaculus TaxID=51337 RepID=UPI001E1AFD92|nr:hepatitis A virus cellular receptor 1 homolog isoform X1 [Jaculus jaculus]XP_045009567.1 hepatitis A virus cellular receptor 1 homolog isoform X1 [Jaculus jaculus]